MKKILFSLSLVFLYSCEITSPALSDLKEVDYIMSNKERPTQCYEKFINEDLVNITDSNMICQGKYKAIPVYFLWGNFG